MARYVVVSSVRKLVKQNGRRAGKDFLHALDAHVERVVVQAAKTHNGGKKTLDAAVAAYLKL